MRILFDSKQPQFKTPFGTLVPGQICTLCIHIPSSVQAKEVKCCIQKENGEDLFAVPMEYWKKVGAYDFFRGKFSFDQCGLFFYRFYIANRSGGFSLYKVGDDTNIEAGDQWQISCVPADFHTPDWAKGAVMYQIFPDRFHKAGKCDLTGKLEPYTVHESWSEEVQWRPDPQGVVHNNDFFGGNFKGITEKMDYIASLGVEILYLNPISKSFSSHRYDTGDYKTPDPMLGTEADFTALCNAAHSYGIRVVLDGVYSHTGANSLYFNKEQAFAGKGAYQDPASCYADWFTFYNWPHTYESWWGFDTLPTVKKMCPSFVEYIITGEDSVVAHWLRAGADGFRLDVADELPDEFIRLLKTRILELKPDALLIGEVWEDASNKIAYDRRRRYFVDGELDGVMNYPFRTAILNFVRDRDDGRNFRNCILSIVENYPPQVLQCNMNLLGSHDTPRVLTALVDDYEGSREVLAQRFLSRSQYVTAEDRLMMASFLQFMLPGCPSIYYGDEAGMEGHKDPFNRRTFPWGRENRDLQAHFKRLGNLRKSEETLRLGDIQFFQADMGRLGFSRNSAEKTLKVYVNRSGEPWDIPSGKILLGYRLQTVAPTWLTLSAGGFCVVEETNG